jgi:single-stranded-DNA-specific exonuclease
LRIDSLLSPAAATPGFIEQIEAAGPYGAAASAPRFAFADQGVTTRRIGENHLRLSFGDDIGARLEGIAFNVWNTPLGMALFQGGHQRFHLAGRLEMNAFNGRSKPQFRLDDAAPA